MKTGFIYIWYDRKHKRFYIGCHVGKEDDGYICSSSWMKKAYKYRPEDFKRRILKRNIPRSDLLAEEHKWLDQIKDDELGTKYYNLSKRHFGHWANDEDTLKTVNDKISAKLKGKKQNTECVQKRVDSRRGYKPTIETKQRLAETIKHWHKSLSCIKCRKVMSPGTFIRWKHGDKCGQ